jgi:hypothetical protein
MNWRVLPMVKINTRISDTPCMLKKKIKQNKDMTVTFFVQETKTKTTSSDT